jgi:hypothetical protein
MKLAGDVFDLYDCLAYQRQRSLECSTLICAATGSLPGGISQSKMLASKGATANGLTRRSPRSSKWLCTRPVGLNVALAFGSLWHVAAGALILFDCALWFRRDVARMRAAAFQTNLEVSAQ